MSHKTWDLTNGSIGRYLLSLENLWFACYSRFIETNIFLPQVTETFRYVTTTLVHRLDPEIAGPQFREELGNPLNKGADVSIH